MSPLFLAFGANLGSPRETISEAIALLSEKFQSKPLASSFYVTKAMTIDGSPGPEYVNCVARFECTLDPDEVLAICLTIEKKLGRIREKDTRWGSRAIDIDILSYGEAVVTSETLKLPHPGIAARDFVLVPLMEIQPDWKHPVSGKSVTEFLGELTGERFIIRKAEEISE